MAKKKTDSKNPKEDKLESEEPRKQNSHEGKSPSDALVEHINKEGFEFKNFIGDYFILAIIGYLFILLLLSIIFPPLFAFILWVIIGFGIYKSIETYGEEKPWFTELSGKIQNFGFSAKKDNDSDNEVEDKEEEQEEENVVSYDDYAEKFDEWRVTKDTVASPFISAGNKVSRFSFNSDGMYKFRLWFLILAIPLIWSLLFAGNGILSIIFTVWYLILGFSIMDATVLGNISALLLSYFLIIRIYSHFTNRRKIPFRADMMADYDPYVVSHLFQSPKSKSTVSITSKALLLDFIGGWFIIIFLMFTSSTASINDIFGLKLTTDFSDFFSLAIVLILFAIAVPIVEELLFRGLLLDALSETYGTWTSIFISSVIFAVLHLSPIGILNAFWGGMIYGYLRIKTNSLWPGIILHALWNGHLEILNFFYFV
jgi:membrane protease YdiL (CAAX protease family)